MCCMYHFESLTMQIIKDYKTFIGITEKGLQIFDIPINDKKEICRFKKDENFVECIKTIEEAKCLKK